MGERRAQFLLLVVSLSLLLLTRGPGLVRALPSGQVSLGQGQVETIWGPLAACLPTFPRTTDDFISYPATASPYLVGLERFAKGNIVGAREAFTQANTSVEHIPALLLLANMEAQTGVNSEEDPAANFPEPNLLLAREFLAIAGRCELVDLHELARDYLERGVRILPADSLDQIDLRTARRVADIYLADEQWEAALPWLAHAAEAGDSALIRYGQTLNQLDRPLDALLVLQEALAYHPEIAGLRIETAETAAKVGQVEAALHILGNAPAWEQLGVNGLLLWGSLCVQESDQRCSRTQIERVLSLEPDNAKAKELLRSLEP